MHRLVGSQAYARGISGSLAHHIKFAMRHFYMTKAVQNAVLAQFCLIVAHEKPELCCLVELDSGSLQSSYINQMMALTNEEYCYADVANKYGANSWLNWMPMHTGNSNGLLARINYAFKKLYFTKGSKRLIYQVDLPGVGTLFFAHFSLLHKLGHCNSLK